MRDCLVVGSGRSGTSMVTGALAAAGYHQGVHLHASRASNPRGFFEAVEVNGLNEELLAPLLAGSIPQLREGQRWLGVPAAGRAPAPSDAQRRALAELCDRSPFCYKDPRFAFTLPAWRPHLGAARFVCVFRHPALTVESLVEECRNASYLRDVELDHAAALRLWTATYRRLLEEARRGEWLFLHYDQVLAPEGRARLGAFLEAPVDAGFPDARLRRTATSAELPAEALELYRELCARAGFTPEDGPAPPLPRVAVLAVIEDADRGHLDELVADTRAQRGVDARLFLVDATTAGLPRTPGARTLRAPSPSRGATLRHVAAEAGRAGFELIALQRPGCRSLPSRLAHAVARLEETGAELVTCDAYLTDAEGRFVDRTSPAAMGDAPGPAWESGLVLRRAALAALPTTAFFPVELALYRAHRAAGSASHVEEPGCTYPKARFDAEWTRATEDAALVTQARAPRPEHPRLTVSLCTYQRREALLACLAALARQDVPAGTFEVVLVNDGSTDGTRELLDALELPFATRVIHQPNGKLAAARNTGLAVARGEYVLFVNDDTIAAPDLVRRHLEAHARAGARKLCVLGSFEQPPEVLGNALLRYLESSGEVFGYGDMVAGETYDAFRFYTCNVSVPLAAVRAAGGFDPSFQHYGCEDTDLAVRLEQLGFRVLYDPRARAWHRHAMDLDYVRRRARLVARAYVRFFRRHPERIASWNMEGLSRETCQAELAEHGADLRRAEAALATLARLDVGALENLGEPYATTARAALDVLAVEFPVANRLWWKQGFLEGLDEHHLAGFAELLEGGAEPWRFSSEAQRQLLAWPRWDDPVELDALMARVASLAGTGFAALVLRYDPRRDPPRERALAALEQAYARRFPHGEAVEVLLEEAPLDHAGLLRLGRSVAALLPLGSEPTAFLRGVVAERLATAADVRAWRERYEPCDAAPAVCGGAGSCAGTPALSVIVPTRDRGAQLDALLDRLAEQDLAPERFEVLVVDDASREDVRAHLASRTFPFTLEVLRGDGRGPAAARNAALLRARGELVLFLNDDAVPGRGLLSGHLRAHRATALDVAVLGEFRLLPEHRRDAVGRHVESSTTLFAQPRMKPGVHYAGLSFCTGNLSVRRAHVLASGGFDEAFPAAGGEDSELGLRLECERGLRVRFDPSLRCGHDHALDVRDLVAKKRVVGAAVHAIQTRHGDVGLTGEVGWPLAADEAARLARELDAAEPTIAATLQAIEQACAEERTRGIDGLASVRPHLERVEHHHFLRGLLEAHAAAGAATRRAADAPPAPLPRASQQVPS